MHDRLATIGERYMAWIKRNSWGRDSFYAIKEDRTPAWQRDAVKELGISKQRISAATQYFVKRGYLREELKILYLVISPQLGPDPKKVRGTPDFFINFIPEWKVTHTPDFLEWETAREMRKVANTTVKRIERLMMADFKKWAAARTSAEKSAAPADSEQRLKSVGTYLPTSGVCRYVGTEPTPGLSDRPTNQPTPAPIPEPLPEPPALPKEESNSVEKEILMLPTVRQLQKKFQSLPSPELLRKIVQKLQGAPLERFNARIEQRFQTVKTFGFLQNLALDVGNAYQHELSAQDPDEGEQAQRQLKIEAWRAILADPNETAEAKEQARKLLEAEVKKE
jgi:hypothetical protein